MIPRRARIAAAAVAALLPGCAARPPVSPGPPVSSSELTRLAAEVRAEFARSWRAYREKAWGHDELKPVSGAFRDWYAEPLLVTPVDALDTMLLMHLDAEAAEARGLIAERLSFDRDLPVQNFEVTIRLLGGLLSAFEMTRDRRLLDLADDLGRRLLPAFSSPTGMPYRFVNLKTGKVSGARSNPAEIGTLVLEFGTLSKWTGNPVYYAKAKAAVLAVASRRSPIGLVGEEIDVETGAWTSTSSHIGGAIDSYHEYLAKGARLFADADLARLWREDRAAVDRWLADETPTGLWYGVSDMATGKRTATEFGALEAFFPAVLVFDGDVGRARRLEDSCFRMWTVCGIEPDGFDYRAMRPTDRGYPLRPEIVESAYYLFRATGDPRYLAMGRRIFDDLKTYCRVDGGYTVLTDVTTKEKGDLMPSFFLAETLKYLYLLFAPADTLDFGRVVFNTEAHPFMRASD